MRLDRMFLVWALSYAAVGLALGIYMGASGNHAQLVTHAHILLLGFVFSLGYAVIHRLWLEKPGRGVANAQFVLHQAGVVMMTVALFLLYGSRLSEATLGPILGIASAGVLLAALLMLYMVIRFGTAKSVTEGP